MMWLNYTHRRFILSGKLKSLIEGARLRGLTFRTEEIEKRISRSNEYDRVIWNAIRAGRSIKHLIVDICLSDIRRAANQFIFVYKRSSCSEGYVSIGISSNQIGNTDGIITEGRFLWKEIKHKNILIEVPATKDSLPAVERLIADGIPVKVSGLFSLEKYRLAAESYISGLERRAEKREALDKVFSVAAFDLSAIDKEADEIIERLILQDNHLSPVAEQMLGKVGCTIAWMLYYIHEELFTSTRFMGLMKKGARPQQLLWDYSHSQKGVFKDLQTLQELQATGGANMVSNEVFADYRSSFYAGKTESENASVIKWRMYQIEQILEVNLQDLAKKIEEQDWYTFNMYSPSMVKVFKDKIKDLEETHSDKNRVLDINPPLINIPILL